MRPVVALSNGIDGHNRNGPPPAIGKRTGDTPDDKRARRRWKPPATAMRRLLTLAEAVAYLGVSPWTIRELQWAGKLPRVTLGRKLLFDRAASMRSLNARRNALGLDPASMYACRHTSSGGAMATRRDQGMVRVSLFVRRAHRGGSGGADTEGRRCCAGAEKAVCAAPSDPERSGA